MKVADRKHQTKTLNHQEARRFEKVGDVQTDVRDTEAPAGEAAQPVQLMCCRRKRRWRKSRRRRRRRGDCRRHQHHQQLQEWNQ